MWEQNKGSLKCWGWPRVQLYISLQLELCELPLSKVSKHILIYGFFTEIKMRGLSAQVYKSLCWVVYYYLMEMMPIYDPTHMRFDYKSTIKSKPKEPRPVSKKFENTRCKQILWFMRWTHFPIMLCASGPHSNRHIPHPLPCCLTQLFTNHHAIRWLEGPLGMLWPGYSPLEFPKPLSSW